MSMLQALAFWLFASVTIVAVIFILTRACRVSGWGFKDLVKNPEHWKFFSQARRELELRMKSSEHWSDDEVTSATRRFVMDVKSSRDAWEKARVLKGLGTRTHPMVLELLRDESLYHRLVKPTGTNVLPEAPFNRACDLLQDSAGSEVVGALAAFLDDPSKEIRKDAASIIAGTGAACIVPHVRRALQDSDQYVRSYALMGLENALRRSVLADTLRSELFSDILTLLREEKNADGAATVLNQLDGTRARELFISPEFFHPDSPVLDHTLAVLVSSRTLVPREALMRLVEVLRRGDLKYPQNMAMGSALRLLGLHQNDQDRNFLQEFTAHPQSYVAIGASASLISLFGLDGFEEKIFDAADSRHETLNEHQRLWFAVTICDGEVNNGGFSQYFVNSSGSLWRDALSGFRAMGFTDRLAIMEAAISIFGTDGPSTDTDVRRKQMSRLYRRNDEIFEDLESRYYGSSEVIEVFLSRFVLKNAGEFR